MKKTLISTAIATSLALGAVSAQAVTITLLNNTTPTNPFAAASLPVNNGAFNGVFDLQGSAPNEFRVMNAGVVSGGGEKSIVDGNQQWIFDDTSTELTGVVGTDTTPGGTPNSNGGLGIAGPGLFLNAAFLFPSPTGDFGFLAPIGAAAANGPATIVGTSSNDFTMFFPVMEAQWAGGTFTIGKSNGGVTFDCQNLHCTAERQIAQIDDSLGFALQYAQWEFDVAVNGTIPQIPVPAAVWLFGSGLLGLVGVARRKKTTS